MNTFLISNSIEEFPEDIQDMIYSKILYSQPKELLDEINKRGVIVNILKSLGQEKVLIKPNLNHISIAISVLPVNERKFIIKKIKHLTQK